MISVEAESYVSIGLKSYKNGRIYMGVYALGLKDKKLVSIDFDKAVASDLLRLIHGAGPSVCLYGRSPEDVGFYFVRSENAIIFGSSEQPIARLRGEMLDDFESALKKMMEESE